uniref:UTRA domain-containing protein n=1 Tax=Campylobacter sp. TaxID=205 RepID=UPI0025BA12D4
ASNKVILFKEILVDKKLSKISTFPLGTELFYIQRIHYLNGKPLILNHHYFLKKLMPELNIEISERSIYDYLENSLKSNIFPINLQNN